MIVLNLILMLIDEVLNAQSAPQVALEHEILLNLKLYVNTENLEVLESVIRVYGSLAICEEGKKKCVEEGTLIVNFIEKIQNFNEKQIKIVVGCIRFLMNISILKRGKVEIFENKGIETLFKVLNGTFGSDDQVALDILQCLTNVAEEPRARKMLQEEKYLIYIKKFDTSKDDLIKLQVENALKVILWEP